MPASLQEYSIGAVEDRTMYDVDTIQTIMEEDEECRRHEALHAAVYDNDIEVIKRHLANSADPNAKDGLGQAPLHIAASQNYPDAVHALLSCADTDKDVRNDAGKTALHLALEAGHFAIATCLLDNGANPELKDADGLIALDCCLSMRKPLPTQTTFGEFFSRHISLMSKLVLQSGRKSACMLAYWDCPELLGKLVAEDRTAVAFADRHQQTALHYCFSEETHVSVACARVLINAGADVNRANVDGATPLHFAAGHELSADADVKAFVRHVVSTHSKIDGMSPLHLAAVAGDAELLRYLGDCDADVDAKDGDGFTALHLGALHGHAGALEALLRSGADANPENQCGQIPLHYAAILPRTACSLALIQDGAAVNHRDHFGMTPLHKAAGWGTPDMVRLLVKKGSDVNAPDDLDQLPIHYSALKGLPEITEILILKGSQVECRDDNGQTPLHLAARAGNVDVIKLLLLHRSDPNAQDVKGQSPMHLACWHGHKEAVQTLINRGASRNVLTAHGHTPDQFASERGYYGILSTLKEHRHSLSLYAPEQLKTFEMFRHMTAPTCLDSLGQEENDDGHGEDTGCDEMARLNSSPNGDVHPTTKPDICGDVNANLRISEVRPDAGGKTNYTTLTKRKTPRSTRCCVVS